MKHIYRISLAGCLLVLTGCGVLQTTVLGLKAGEMTADTYETLNKKQVYIFNDFNQPIKIAVHFRIREKWYTRGWCTIQPAEKKIVLNEPIESTVIYLHVADIHGRPMTPDEGFSRPFLGQLRPFRIYNLASVYGDNTFELRP